MAAVTATIDLDRPPEATYAYASDPARCSRG